MSDPFVSHLRLKILLYFVLDSVNFIRAAHNGKVSLLKSNLLFCTIKNALPYTGLTDTISCQSKAKVWTFNTLSHILKTIPVFRVAISLYNSMIQYKTNPDNRLNIEKIFITKKST